ncbi:MAG: endopeptidase La [candidate division Zixibacteria bacterium]|nr:endopeptidase La [candidate division Zixibacteria bacterium]
MNENHEIDQCEIPEKLPLLPLVTTAVFPHAVVSLQVRLASSLAMLEAEGSENQIIAAAITQKGVQVAKTLKDFHEIGVACRIISRVKIPNNTIQLVIQGITRIKLERLLQAKPYLKVKIHSLHPQTSTDSASTREKIDKALNLFEQLAILDNHYPPEMVQIMKANTEVPGRFADLLASYLGFRLGEKQYLVAAVEPEERLERLSRLLTAEVHKLRVAQEVESQVQTDLSKSQRDYYLRQQMAAIRKALGEDDSSSEIEELRQKLADADLPEAAAVAADRELVRLSNISTASPEYHIIRTYLDWIIELPWSNSTEDNLDIITAHDTLEADHYGLTQVKERILEFLAVRHRRQNPRGPILCLAGPPGVGKTSLGQSIARALGRRFVRISVGGMRDEAEIRGHRRTYIGALPGKVIQELRNCGCNNPLFMIDEIDKMGADFRGDPSSAMLEVLDPEQNFSFRDHYLDIPFNLSKVFFIATANMLETIPPPLRDRMEVIEISGYTMLEKVKIAQTYLIKRQQEAAGLKPEEIEITEAALKKIISSYTYEAGVRNLERNIASICRKGVRKILEGVTGKIVIDEGNIEDFLGPAKRIPDVAGRTPQVGLVTGLAWTPAGGDLLMIETIKMKGHGKVMVTGRLGDVMSESVEAAYSYVRSKAGELGLEPEVFEEYDIHIHFPEGAIPKDGPSAGVAVTIALISLLTEQPVYPDLAITGEVSLRGKVLPVGGVKEKCLAAYRAGIKRVALPESNAKDLTEVPEEVHDSLDFIFLQTVDDVLEHALGKIIVPSGEIIESIESMASDDQEKITKPPFDQTGKRPG